MKHVAVFFDAPGYDDYPFHDEEYRVAYHELAENMHVKGGTLWIVRGQKTFLGGNRFSHGWKFDGSAFQLIEKSIEVDVIYDKGYFQSDDASVVINDRAFDELCVDKWKAVSMFPEHSPKTMIVSNRGELMAALDAMQADRIVVKPKDGEEGKGVFIGPREQLLVADVMYPAIVQAFIDTSGGIPGVIEGMHDLRLHSINGDMALAFVRTPPLGKFLANVSQGGKQITIPNDQVPAEAMKIFYDIDQRLSHFRPRVYSVDLGRDADGSWKVIELNSKPGVSWKRRGVVYETFLATLVDVLLE